MLIGNMAIDCVQVKIPLIKIHMYSAFYLIKSNDVLFTLK